MGTIIELVWKYKTVILIGLLLLTIGVMAGYMGIVKKDRDAAVALSNSLRTELGISQQSEKNLEAGIKTQNGAVDTFKTDADKRLASRQVDIAKANVTATAIKKHGADILATLPMADTTACVNANTLFNQELANVVKK